MHTRRYNIGLSYTGIYSHYNGAILHRFYDVACRQLMHGQQIKHSEYLYRHNMLDIEWTPETLCTDDTVQPGAKVNVA